MNEMETNLRIVEKIQSEMAQKALTGEQRIPAGFWLNLGCGSKPIPGMVNIDKYPSVPDVVQGDITHLEFNDGEVALIYASHSIEHLTIRDSKRCLQECVRVLKIGGRLIIMVPDLEGIMRAFLAGGERSREWYLFTLFGYQTDPDARPYNKGWGLDDPIDEGQFHKTGYTEESLREILSGLGMSTHMLMRYDGYSTPSIYYEGVKWG